MTPEAIVICAVIMFTAFIALAAPFRRRASTTEAIPPFQRQRDALLVYYQQVTSSLRDLQDEAAIGKLSPEVYEAERERWMLRGVQILRALDELDTRAPETLEGAQLIETDVEIEAMIEQAVQHQLDEQRMTEMAHP